MASVRAIVPGQIKDETIFRPLEGALSRYPAELWELVIGAATAANLDEKTVEVAVADGTTRHLAYDQLVLTTGARSASPGLPWKASDTHESTLAALHDTAARVKSAQHIVVGGAGSTGVEIAGELGYEYGKAKEIVLLCGGDKILNGDSIAPAATHELKKLNVTIKYASRVTDARPVPTEGGDGNHKTQVLLSSGETLTTDLYLPATGLVPNTEYIPGRYLSADPAYRTVLVDEHLRVADAEGAWACGDVVSKPRAGFLITQKQAAGVAKNVEAALAGREPTVVKGPPADIFACSVGRDRGAGRMNSIRLPSFGVWLAKGRTLGVQRMQGYIDGSVA